MGHPPGFSKSFFVKVLRSTQGSGSIFPAYMGVTVRVVEDGEVCSKAWIEAS